MKKLDKDILKSSWSVGLPMTLVMFYEFLIGLTDVYVAGKFGKTGQAAYGFAFQMYFVFIIIGIALSIGTVSVVSRLFASGRKEDFNAAVNSSMVTATAAGFIFGMIGILFSRQIIGLFDLPSAVKAYAAPFLAIYSVAFLFDYVLMSANGILRACGMTNRSLWAMSIACVINIPLDFILALHTPLGLKGIAAATAISLFIGMIITLYFTEKLIKGFKFSAALIKKIFNISWPSGLLQILWQLGALVLFLIISLLPRYNVETMAALTNGLKIESALFLPAIAFNMAAAVVVGNFLGKKENNNAFRGGMITAIAGVALVTVMTVIVLLNARRIAGFLSDNDIVVKECVRYVHIALIVEPVLAWGIILGGGLNGSGDTRSVMMVTALSVWLVRVPLAYFLSIRYGLGPAAVWWSMNISILIQAALITLRYFSRAWIVQSESTMAV